MEQGLNTDHFPIISNFNLDVKLTPKKVISNFRDVDWQEFCKMLEKKINAWGVPNFIKSQKVLERECKRLTIALQETISEAVPSVVLGLQAKHWWTKELNTLRKDMLKCHRKACRNRNARGTPLWEQFREARHKFGQELEKMKKNHWRDWLERAMDPDLWTAQKYITAPPGDCGKMRIPDLIHLDDRGQHCASSN
jgi:hypothetical protein